PALLVEREAPLLELGQAHAVLLQERRELLAGERGPAGEDLDLLVDSPGIRLLGRRHPRKATRLFKPAGERRLRHSYLLPEPACTDRVLSDHPSYYLALKRWREWSGYVVVDSAPPRSNGKSRQLPC